MRNGEGLILDVAKWRDLSPGRGVGRDCPDLRAYRFDAVAELAKQSAATTE